MRRLRRKFLKSFSSGATIQLPLRKIAPLLGLGFGLGLVMGLGAIFLGRGNSPDTFIKLPWYNFRSQIYSSVQIFIRLLRYRAKKWQDIGCFNLVAIHTIRNSEIIKEYRGVARTPTNI